MIFFILEGERGCEGKFQRDCSLLFQLVVGVAHACHSLVLKVACLSCHDAKSDSTKKTRILTLQSSEKPL